MKQNKISKPYLNPMKKFNLENNCKDETEIQQLRNEKSHIKEHEYQIKVSRINKGKLTKSKNESKDKTTKTKCTSKENTKNKNLSKEKLSRKRKVFSKEKLSEKKNISKQKDENAKFDEERIKKELKEKEKEKQDKIKKLNSFYNNNQNKIIINKLGVDIFTYNKILEVKLIPSNFLFRHKLVPEIRTKMVNWMCEIFYAYNSDFQTYFIAVDIMDKYINNSRKIIYNEDIHLIGITCIFIASKYEDYIPFSMKNIISEIAKNKYKENDIINKEKEILKEINFDIISVSTYDFVNIFIYDLKMNNIKAVKSLDLYKHLHHMRKTCLFLSQMLLLDELFSSYESSLKALCCLICSYDVLLSTDIEINDKTKKFIKDWILFNINESNFTQDEINCLYERLSYLYNNIRELTERTSGDYFNIVKIFLNEDFVKKKLN